ncbi:ROK family protein [Asticcacaulis endophyticus]|uniref:Glucokinase n=1 Tax=Asticcacaulis endophyticus TaxID=1395890 RepID=A0A918PSG5_9CAUL|nr:ROK family protein [Asticcacaulis endophyticus]GGZ21349.1 glucokinase [Asticcacaulis endophyticus]
MIYTGIDFGGTKIEAAILDSSGAFLARERIPNPGAYAPALKAIAELITTAEQMARDKIGDQKLKSAGGGIGIPGSVSPRTDVVRNANSTWLNGRPLLTDLQEALLRPVRLSNDANCLALSEAMDGAAAGSDSVAAVILGTGFGGGLVLGGRLIQGANGIAGEIGHFGLPWAEGDESPGPPYWCGQRGCVETWVSGTGFARDFTVHTGQVLTAEAIIAAMRQGDPHANAAFQRFISRLGRTLATLVNLYDPEVFVLGGGLSNVSEIYEHLPDQIRTRVFSDAWEARIAPARWGDSSGVRGAAYLWRDTSDIPPRAAASIAPSNLAVSA